MTTPDQEPSLTERISSAPHNTDSGAMTLAGYVVYRAEIRSDMEGDEALTATAESFLVPPEGYRYEGEPLEKLSIKELGWIAQGYGKEKGEKASLGVVRGVLHEAAQRLGSMPLETTVSWDVHGLLSTISFAQDTIAWLEGQET